MSNVFWSPGMKIETVETQIIKSALRFFENDREVTCRSLGISRRTLDSRIADYKKEEQSKNENKDIATSERKDIGL